VLPLPDKPSIAVLPFQNTSGDPEQEYFADGMVEEIIFSRWHFQACLSEPLLAENQACKGLIPPARLLPFSPDFLA
jgi:hypothetical protein